MFEEEALQDELAVAAKNIKLEPVSADFASAFLSSVMLVKHYGTLNSNSIQASSMYHHHHHLEIFPHSQVSPKLEMTTPPDVKPKLSRLSRDGGGGGVDPLSTSVDLDVAAQVEICI